MAGRSRNAWGKRVSDAATNRAAVGDTTEGANATATGENTVAVVPRHSLSRDLSLLLSPGARIWARASPMRLWPRTVLDGLLEAVPAEVGAILTMKDGHDLGSDSPPSPRSQYQELHARQRIPSPMKSCAAGEAGVGRRRGPRPLSQEPRKHHDSRRYKSDLRP